MKKQKKSTTDKFISIEDASKTSLSQDIEAIDDLASRIKDLEKRAKEIDFSFSVARVVVVGVIVVFFVAFLGLALDAWRFHASSYEDCRKAIDSLQNQKQDQENEALNRIVEELQSIINHQKEK